MGHNMPKDLQPYNSSLQDFCRFLEDQGQQTTSPKSIAALWESQAEALRIRREDASVESIDMLLNTMLTTLHHLADAEEEQRWTKRMKALLRGRPEQAGYRPPERNKTVVCDM